MTARGKFNVRAQPLGHGAIGLCFGHGASPGTVIQSTVDYYGRIPHLGIGGYSARCRNQEASYDTENQKCDWGMLGFHAGKEEITDQTCERCHPAWIRLRLPWPGDIHGVDESN
jgi:hypothetical protein